MNIDNLNDIIDRINGAEDKATIRQIVSDLSPEETTGLLAYLAWLARRPQRPRGLRVPAEMAVHHINGNPHDQSPANLRLVPIRPQRRANG